jgi:hypothetical protein
MDFFFWDYMKNIICKEKTAGLQILWHCITEVTTTVTGDMLVNCDIRSSIISTCVKQLTVLTPKITRGRSVLLDCEITSSVYEFSFLPPSILRPSVTISGGLWPSCSPISLCGLYVWWSAEISWRCQDCTYNNRAHFQHLLGKFN